MFEDMIWFVCIYVSAKDRTETTSAQNIALVRKSLFVRFAIDNKS